MDYEVIFWIVCAVIAWGAFGLVFLPWNDRFDPKNDPYKNCPKEEE